MSVDDAALLQILSFLDPLPDGFACAATCRRFRHVATDRRLALHVSSSTASLAAAVLASRPGQTIYLAPGVHELPTTVSLEHPLNLQRSPLAKSTGTPAVLRVASTAPAGLAVHANTRLCEVECFAEHGPCIIHVRGSLLLERCALRTRPHALRHLSPPVLSRVTSPEFVLTVCETIFEGGVAAVLCEGSGVVLNTRVIVQRSSSITYWFSVRSIVKSIEPVSESCLDDETQDFEAIFLPSTALCP